MRYKPIKRGETVYTVLRHVSRSGMFRVIDAFLIRDNEPVNLLAVLTEQQREKVLNVFKRDKKRDGFRVSGCGMDMGFHLVYSISSRIFERKGRDSGNELRQRWI